MNTDCLDFEDLRESDLPQIFEWLHRPHVARWWPDPGDYAAFAAEWRAELARDWHFHFLIVLDERPIGFLQTYHAARAGDGWWPDENEGTRGIDLFIGEESLTGRGLGPDIVRACALRLLADPSAQSVITDPHPDNHRSVRCFEKAGFQPEGRIQTPDGDALLMRLRRDATHLKP